MRTSFRANYWLCIVCSLALVMSVFSSPIRDPQPVNTSVHSSFLFRNFALVTKSSEPVLKSVIPGDASIGADEADFKGEEDEDESFWSFSHLAASAFIPSDPPRKHLSLARTSDSPPRTAGVPLRC